MRALSASCVDIGGELGNVASALSCARPPAEMRRMTVVSGEVAMKGCGGACSSSSAFDRRVDLLMYAGWCSMLNTVSLVRHGAERSGPDPYP